MSLSQNIKRFRQAVGLSQEYVADLLCMSQPAYSRLENSETACAQRLARIAQALGTTPEVLQHYHLDPEHTPPPATANAEPQPEMMRLEKDEFIRSQAEEISFLRNQVSYLQAVWHQYCGGGSVHDPLLHYIKR